MATRSISKPARSAARADSPDTWPVIWRVTAPGAVEGFKPGLGITPAIDGKLAEAAVAIRRGMELVEDALQLAEPDSDTDMRCSDAIDELNMALQTVEWQPPEEAGD